MAVASIPQRAQRGGLPGDKAARIDEAMRASVASRGIAGSTFDHVAREAGVARGLLHYCFQTKERLLVEVVRLECEARGELLDQAVSGVAGFLFGLADGIAIRRLSEPELPVEPLLAQAIAAFRAQLA